MDHQFRSVPLLRSVASSSFFFVRWGSVYTLTYTCGRVSRLKDSSLHTVRFQSAGGRVLLILWKGECTDERGCALWWQGTCGWSFCKGDVPPWDSNSQLQGAPGWRGAAWLLASGLLPLEKRTQRHLLWPWANAPTVLQVFAWKLGTVIIATAHLEQLRGASREMRCRETLRGPKGLHGYQAPS